MNVEGTTQSLLIRTRNEPMQPVRPGFATEDLNQWLALNARVNKQVSELWEGDIQRVLKDRALSPEGKVQKLATLAERITPDFSFLGNVLQQADAARDRLTKLLYDPITAKPKGNEIVIFLREQEIRQALRSASASERQAKFLLALEADDLETSRALLDWPGGPMISADIRRRGEEAYARRVNAPAWEKLQAVEYMREHLASLATQTGQWLMSLGATPERVQKAVKTSD